MIAGVITAMVTPFEPDGALDLDATRRVARHLVAHGSHGVVVAGTTGESPTLSDDEILRLLDTVLDEIGDEAIVIAGTGSNNTSHAAGLTAKARDVGAHAALVVTPYYNKPNRAGILAHYSAVAERGGDLPLVLYNIPSRTALNLAPDLLAELAATVPSIVAVKQANDDELGPIEGIDVLAGNDNTFARTLAFGGPGGILVASHLVGARMRELYEAAIGGDHDRAAEIDAELTPVYEATATTNPIPVKTGVELLGVADAVFRLPLVPATDEERELVRSALEGAGVLGDKPPQQRRRSASPVGSASLGVDS
jgi:4-hydroxy-tetrahydrodipicolinate synthase